MRRNANPNVIGPYASVTYAQNRRKEINVLEIQSQNAVPISLEIRDGPVFKRDIIIKIH